MHAGLVAAAIYNTNRGKGSRPVKANDFLLIERDAKTEARAKNSAFAAALRAMAKPRK